MSVQDLNYNFFNTLIFSGIIYGYFFCIINFYGKATKSKARNFLVLTILTMTFSNTQYWLIDVGFRELYQIPKVFYIQCELLILPFFHLFVLEYLNKKVTKKLVGLILLPFVLGMIYQITMYLLGIRKPELTRYNIIVEFFTISYSLFLIVSIFIRIYSYEKKNEKNTVDISVKTKWIKYTLAVGLSICIIWMLTSQLFYSQVKPSFKTFYPLWVSLSILIYWVGNKGLIELRVWSERKMIRKTKSLISYHAGTDALIENKKGKELFDRVLRDIEEREMFLNPILSLASVASIYHITPGYLSQVINKYSEDSFTDFINKLRVEAAKKMLLDESFSKYTISAISLESGFNTKSNFYSVFKKITSQTPNEYKKVQYL